MEDEPLHYGRYRPLYANPEAAKFRTPWALCYSKEWEPTKAAEALFPPPKGDEPGWSAPIVSLRIDLPGDE